MRRFQALGTAQFLAAIAIMVRHYAHFLESAFPTLAEALGRLNFVEFFFASSGFLLVLSQRDKPLRPIAFISRRVRRIYPLHALTTGFFAVIVMAVVAGVHAPSDPSLYRLSDVFFHLALLHAWGVGGDALNYPSWYLSAQLSAYCLFVPVLYLLQIGRAAIVICVAMLSVAALEIVSLAGESHWTSWTYHFGVARAVPTFLAGMLLGWWFDTIRSPVRSFLPAYAAAVLSLSGMVLMAPPTLTYVALQVALVWLLAAAEANGARTFLQSAPFACFAPLSFPLFLVHVPVATVLLSFGYKVVLGNPTAYLLPAVGFTMVAAIGCAFLAHLVLDVWWPVRGRALLTPFSSIKAIGERAAERS